MAYSVFSQHGQAHYHHSHQAHRNHHPPHGHPQFDSHQGQHHYHPDHHPQQTRKEEPSLFGSSNSSTTQRMDSAEKRRPERQLYRPPPSRTLPSRDKTGAATSNLDGAPSRGGQQSFAGNLNQGYSRQSQQQPSHHSNYPQQPLHPNSYNTGSSSSKQGNYTVFRSKWHGDGNTGSGQPIITNSSSTSYLQKQQPFTVPDQQFFGKKVPYSESIDYGHNHHQHHYQSYPFSSGSGRSSGGHLLPHPTSGNISGTGSGHPTTLLPSPSSAKVRSVLKGAKCPSGSSRGLITLNKAVISTSQTTTNTSGRSVQEVVKPKHFQQPETTRKTQVHIDYSTSGTTTSTTSTTSTSSTSSTSSTISTISTTTSTTTVSKGGILRLNTESMKLLNETMVKSNSQNNSTKSGTGSRRHSDRNSFSGHSRYPSESSATSFNHHNTIRVLKKPTNSTSTNSTSSSSSPSSPPANLSSLDHNYGRDLAKKLNYVLATNAHQSSTLVEHDDLLVEPLRVKLMRYYESLLLGGNLKSSSASSALQDVWSHCFYPFVDTYRRHLMAPDTTTNATPTSRHLSQQLSALVGEGIRFFESLVGRLCTTYHFTPQALIDRRKHYELNRTLFSSLQELTYYMKILYIYMGDLTRYYQSVQPKPNFEVPKSYYMKAHILVPKNAHACSQLAMINYYQKRLFEAIYYFIRSFETEANLETTSDSTGNELKVENITNSSLTTYSPTPGSTSVPSSSRHTHKQMLTVIFDDIRTSYEEQLKALVAEHRASITIAPKSTPKGITGPRGLEGNQDFRKNRRNKDYRIEYWIRDGQGSSGTSMTIISKCDMYDFYDLAAATSAESDPELLDFYRAQLAKTVDVDNLKKRFISSFLMVHGMLNCRSGNLDRFFDVAKQMLLEFEQLLLLNGKDNQSLANETENQGLSSLLLVQLLVVNIYTISNTITEADRSQNAAQYSFTHMNAYFIMSSMVEAILRRLIILFNVFKRKHAHFTEHFKNSKSARGSFSSAKSDEKEETATTTTLTLEDLFRSPSVKVEFIDQVRPEEEVEWQDFYRLLPVIKIWADWVISTKPRFPPAEMNDIGLRPHQNETIWHVFGRFLTLLNEFQSFPVNFYREPAESGNPLAFSPPKCTGNAKNEYELVQLPEDRVLEGFRMILNAPESSKYIKLPYLAESAYTYMRIASIQLFGDYLCGMETPYLRFNGRARIFESLIEVDDVEGCPGVKLGAVQEAVFHASLAQFMSRLVELGIEEKEVRQKGGDGEDGLDKEDNGKLKKNVLMKNKKKAQLKLRITIFKDKDDEAKENDEVKKEENDEDTDDDDEEDDDDEFKDEDEAIEEMNQLGVSSVERRKLLQYRQLMKNCPQKARYFKLMEHLNDKKRRFIIKPRYVLLDTNCLISNLEAIKYLVAHAPFTVLIPLIVVHELEFMVTRGGRATFVESTSSKLGYGENPSTLAEERKKAERYVALGKKATLILEYLKEVFGSLKTRPSSRTDGGGVPQTQKKTPNIRAVTSKGSLLDTIDFKEDRNDPNAFNNDDLVLYSASRLIESLQSNSSNPADQSPESLAEMLQQAGEKEVSARDEFIFREVVLVTDDLDLRLKALCFEVPVKKLTHFLKWAKVKEPKKKEVK